MYRESTVKNMFQCSFYLQIKLFNITYYLRLFLGSHFRFCCFKNKNSSPDFNCESDGKNPSSTSSSCSVSVSPKSVSWRVCPFFGYVGSLSEHIFLLSLSIGSESMVFAISSEGFVALRGLADAVLSRLRSADQRLVKYEITSNAPTKIATVEITKPVAIIMA